MQGLGTLLNRELVLIAESDLNDPRLVSSREAGGFGLAAQWSDDFHHAVHAAITGERQGYYGDFGSMGALVKTLARVFFHDGNYSSFRGPQSRSAGRPCSASPASASSATCRITTRSATGPPATGSPAGCPRTWSRPPLGWC